MKAHPIDFIAAGLLGYGIVKKNMIVMLAGLGTAIYHLRKEHTIPDVITTVIDVPVDRIDDLNDGYTGSW